MLALIPGFWLQDTSYLDKFSLWLMVCLALQFLISLRLTNGTTFPSIAVIIINFSIFIFPRSLEYLYIPQLVVFPLIENVDKAVFNKGLLYFVAGNALLLIGIHVGGAVLKKKTNSALHNNSTAKSDVHRDLLPLALIFALSVGMQILCQCLQGISVIGETTKTQYNLLVQVLCLLFSVDTALVCVVAACIVCWNSISKMELACFWAILALYLGTTTYFGSRVGMLRILFATAIAFLVVHANKNINISKQKACFIAILSTFVGCIAFICYITGSSNRCNLGIKSLESNGIKNKISENVIKKRIQETKKEKDKLNNLSLVFSSILNRLGTLDFAILTSSLNRSGLPVSAYGSLSYTLKSIANSVPGTPFPEADLNTSQVHDIVFSGRKEEDVKKGGYFSRPWTIWGLSTLFTVSWWGYAALMAIFGFLMHALYWATIRIKNHYGTYIQILMLFVILPLIYFSMGVDHSIIVGIGIVVQTSLIILLLEIARRFRIYVFDNHQSKDSKGRSIRKG